MQNKKPVQILRYLFIIAFLIVVCSVFCARLVSLQIVDRPEGLDDDIQTYERTETIVAARGEIYDRNGVKLVKNSYARAIILDYGDMPWTIEETNALILACVEQITLADGEEGLTPIEYFPFASVTGDVRYKESYLEGGEDHFRLERMLARYEKKADMSAADFLGYLMARWHLTGSDDELMYSEEETYILLSRRLDMDYEQYGPSTPYYISYDASMGAISRVLELGMRGVLTRIKSEREYLYPGYMSHVLGKTGKIPAEQADSYRELGYPMDAIVGTSGLEAVYEQYLHGTDGEITIIEDKEGNELRRYVSREPSAGSDVYLTIDINLQKAAEDSLAYRIKKVAAEGGALSGADADAGAVVALEPNSNGVLAIASYPTYDLTTFEKEYAALAEDEKAPLLNRATGAAYAPGSTFKLCTGLAALTEGLITEFTTIKDKGVYRYYDDYQPHCWVYDQKGTTHGEINVAQAIEHSCNYFFFDVGRVMGIDTLCKYANAFGLGRGTGIEIPETTGILASPSYVEGNDIAMWMPGDTLSASIGQSYHLFTPIQLACYLSTVVNHGTRYSAHLLYEVRNFSTGETVAAYENKVMDDTIPLSEEHVKIIKYGMRLVMNQTLTKRAFRDLTAVSAAGKTGTAQIGSKSSDNATFVSFAPYSEHRPPEIVIAGIIEHGATGNNTAYVISDIMEQYFQGEAEIGT